MTLEARMQFGLVLWVVWVWTLKDPSAWKAVGALWLIFILAVVTDITLDVMKRWNNRVL